MSLFALFINGKYVFNLTLSSSLMDTILDVEEVTNASLNNSYSNLDTFKSLMEGILASAPPSDPPLKQLMAFRVLKQLRAALGFAVMGVMPVVIEFMRKEVVKFLISHSRSEFKMDSRKLFVELALLFSLHLSMSFSWALRCLPYFICSSVRLLPGDPFLQA